MRTFRTALLLPLLLAACGPSDAPQPKPGKIAISDAIVRLPAADGRPAAGYFTVDGGAAADRLVSISSPKAATIELHETKMVGGMMSMQPLTGIDVPAGGKVVFAPGGNHAMLFGIDPAVKAGSTIPLTFTFQNLGTIETQAKTIGAGESMPGTGAEHDGH